MTAMNHTFTNTLSECVCAQQANMEKGRNSTITERHNSSVCLIWICLLDMFYFYLNAAIKNTSVLCMYICAQTPLDVPPVV